MPDDAEPTYYAWLPGPWVIVKRSWQRRSTLQDLIIEAECEACADRVVCDVEGGDEDARRRSVEQARLHWEGHVEGEFPLAFFALPCLGDLKVRREGTWADVLVQVPYFISPGDPVPPRCVVNSVLRVGVDHAGMSGGCEWPRHELSDRENQELRRDLAARGYVDVDVPDWVRTRSDYQDWRFSLAWDCSPEAVRAWSAVFSELGEDLGEATRRQDQAKLDAIAAEQRRHFAERETWLRAFDAANH